MAYKAPTMVLTLVDEATFLDIFEGVPQANIPKAKIEKGLDMIARRSYTYK